MAVEAELLCAIEAVDHRGVRAVHFPADLADAAPKVAGPQRDDLGLAAVKLPPQLAEILLKLFILRDRRVVLW